MTAYPRNETLEEFEVAMGFFTDKPERRCACATCPFAAWRVIELVYVANLAGNKQRISEESSRRTVACHCTHLNTETMRQTWSTPDVSSWSTEPAVWGKTGASEVVSRCSARELEVVALARAAEEAL